MEKKIFIEYLRDRGLKFTREREAILSEICSRSGHFDPDELHAGLREKGARVSRASVYRTLPLLVGCGLIEEVERTEKHAHYEHVFGREHHDHMLCLSCGRVIEFSSDQLERLQDKVCRDEGFEGVTHTLEIKGYCADCRSGG